MLGPERSKHQMPSLSLQCIREQTTQKTCRFSRALRPCCWLWVAGLRLNCGLKTFPWFFGAQHQLTRSGRCLCIAGRDGRCCGEMDPHLCCHRGWRGAGVGTVGMVHFVSHEGHEHQKGLPTGYGSIPINTIFSGMNIHLPAILMFTRGIRFWHTANIRTTWDISTLPTHLYAYSRAMQDLWRVVLARGTLPLALVARNRDLMTGT